MDTRDSIAAVLAAYPLETSRVTPLGSAGGFSGSSFWRVDTPSQAFCLRRWSAEHPSPERLRFIHDVLRYVYQRAVTQIALPVRARHGETFIRHRGHLWEMAPWMPGRADYPQNPSPARLQAALSLLARFHLAAGGFQPRPPSISPGIAERLELLDSFRQDGAQRIAASIGHPAGNLDRAARQILQLFTASAPAIRSSLEVAACWQVPIQPCLRDIWHDHLLFTGDQVSGLIDFGALRYESVAADVARLLGSLAGSDRAAWRIGMDVYQQARPLSRNERMLVDVFHDSNLLLSGMNWLRWIYVEKRTFENWQRVFERIDYNLAALRNLHK